MKPCYKSPKVEIENVSVTDILLNSDVLIPGESLFGPNASGTEE